jgi:metal-dependent HD superfamily phosphatase/phosphodiesterase
MTEQGSNIACISMKAIINKLATNMQKYNDCAGVDNRSAGIYRYGIYQLIDILTECGFKPNIIESQVVRDDTNYVVYDSMDFKAYTQTLNALGINNDIYEFTY